MSRHTFAVLYEDQAQGRTFRVRSYVQAASADEARAIFVSVKVLRIKVVK